MRRTKRSLWSGLIATFVGVAALVAWLARDPSASRDAVGRVDDSRTGVTAIDVLASTETVDSDVPSDGARSRAEFAAEAPSSAAVAPLPPTASRVRALVLDDDERPVSDVVVALAASGQRSPPLLATTNADGWSVFEDPPRGSYRASVHAASLPDGWVGPIDTATNGYEGRYESRALHVGRGDDVEIRLHVFRAATLEGRVVDLEGRPIADVGVRAQSAGLREPPALAETTRTDASGRFRMEGVRGGYYRIEVWGAAIEDPRYPDPRNPLERDVIVDPGAHVDVGAIPIGDGTHTIRGRVLDEDGRPLPRVMVTTYWVDPPAPGFRRRLNSSRLATAFTDEDGRYALTRLPSVGVKVIAGLDCDERPPGVRGAAHWANVGQFDLHDGPTERDAPTVTCPRSMPFTLRVSIHVPAAWRADQRSPRTLPQAEIVLDRVAGRGWTPERKIWLDYDSRVSLTTDWDEAAKRDATLPIEGHVVWRCETPHPPAILRLAYEKTTVERPFDPIPDGELDLALSFPE